MTGTETGISDCKTPVRDKVKKYATRRTERVNDFDTVRFDI